MKLRINLLSDLCSHSGDTYNSYIDTDIVYDEYGFPYIPAKRIKGCIREACMELKNFGIVSEDDYNALFGTEGNAASKFQLDNAYLVDYQKMIDDICKANDKVLTHQQRILQLFTYVRTQTAIEHDTGVADDSTLRTTRVARKGLIFEADLTMDENITFAQQKALETSIRMVKHIGCARSRGLGLVNLEMKDSGKTDFVLGNKNREFDIQKTNENVLLSYRIELNSPVICKSDQGNQAVTQDFIAGSKVLGMLVGKMGKDVYKKLPDDSILRVSNAYIECNKERTTPLSKSLQKVKDQAFITDDGDGFQRLPVKDLLLNYTGDEQLTSVGHYYVTASSFVKSVDTEINYHHRRPEDKSIGRANGKDDSAFYQLESISRGQTFLGFVEADYETARLLISKIPEKINTRMGYGKGSEYGSVNFKWDKIDVKKSAKSILVNEFSIKLNSPVIMYNENGCFSAEPTLLIQYLRNKTNCTDLALKEIYADYTTIGGYNVTWNARKPTFTALAAGTVCMLTSKSGADCSALEKCFIGERTREGYGEVELYKNKDVETFVYKSDFEQNTDINQSQNYSTDIIRDLNVRQMELKVEADGRNKAKTIVEQLKIKSNGDIDAIIGRLILMFRGEDNLADLKTQVNGIETDSKRELSLKLLKPIEQYISESNEYLTEMEVYKIFVKAYLGQIKYMIRSSRTERRA